MELTELNKGPNIEKNIKLNRKFLQFKKLISELKKHQASNEIVAAINHHIDKINSFSNSEKELSKRIKRGQSDILKLVEKELNLVTKNHYRNTLLAVGIATGVAVGITIGSSTGNMSLLAMGITIGMAIGMAAGTSKDKKAKDSGKQLDLEIKN